MYKVTASIDTDHFKTVIDSDNNTLIADEPDTLGGRGKGFSPGELLASALASCITITLRMYADRKEWPLERIEADVAIERDEINNVTKIRKTIKLFGDLNEAQRQRLMGIADKCPIHKILANPIEIKAL